jgi:uncharacterized membrane protein YbhN (UPF0104 family)
MPRPAPRTEPDHRRAPARSASPGAAALVWRRLHVAWHSPGAERWRRWLPHLLGLLLAAAALGFVVARARHIDWHAVREALRATPWPVLLGAVLFATGSHTCYAAYDLLARRYLGHRVAPLKVVAVGFVSYAFNLNLGAIVGGIGLRWRLYSRLGLDAAQTGRIYAFSLVANWAGYLLLSGLLLGAGRFALPPPLDLPTLAQRALGLVLIALPLLYVTWCAGSRRQRTLRWRRYSLEFPGGRAAMAQVALSVCHWSLAAVTVWVLLRHGAPHLPFLTVLGTLLLAAVAGALIHVPGGLGVIEAVFIATLRHHMPEGQLVAAVLAYRAAYYLLPLAGATVLYLALEAHARHDAPGEREAGR